MADVAAVTDVLVTAAEVGGAVVDGTPVVDVTLVVEVGLGRAAVVSGWSDSPSGDVREMYKGAGDVLTEPAMAKAAPPVAASAVAARAAGIR